MPSISETTQTAPLQFSESVQVAMQLLRNGEYGLAIQHCEQSLENEPDNLGLVWELGLAYFLGDDALTAQMTWLAGLGQATEHQEDAWRQQLVERLDQEAVWQYQQNNLETVQALCDQILELQPRHQGAMMGLGNVAMLQENYDEAIAHFQQLLENSPDNPEGVVRLTHCFFVQQNYDQAERYAQHLLTLTPQSAVAHAYLGQCMLQHNEIENAISCFQKAIDRDVDYIPAYFGIGKALCKQGNYQQATTALETFLKHNPDHAEGLNFLGESLYNSGYITPAAQVFQRVMKLAPSWIAPQLSLAKCFSELDMAQEAIALLDPIISNHSILPQALAMRAYCAYQQEDIELSITLLRQALTHYPDDIFCRKELGLTLRIQGKIDEAIAEWRHCLELAPHREDIAGLIRAMQQCEQAGYLPDLRQGKAAWDAMIFKDENCYRLFYLRGDRRIYPFYKAGELCTATSTDLKTWQYHGTALKPQPEHPWESGRILAGNVYQEDGTYYFFYSAAPAGNQYLKESIGLATSKDGIHWQQPAQPLVEPDTRYYTTEIREFMAESEERRAWRDPSVIRDPQTGQYYMFMTTCTAQTQSLFKGCIGLAVADCITGPYTVLPPLLYPTIPGTDEGIFSEMERPQIIFKDGRYHLFASSSTRLMNPNWLTHIGHNGLDETVVYHFVANHLTGPYKPLSDNPLVPGSNQVGLYGLSFIEDREGEWFAVGCDHALFTLEVSGQIRVCWSEDSIEITESENSFMGECSTSK